MFKNFFKYSPILIIFFIPVFAFANTGVVDSVYNKALLCINDSCSTSTSINFKTTLGTPIQITDTKITGNAWSETFGWINFNPTFGGVTNTSNGVLGGYAWGDQSGWINFSPTLGGVVINSSGQFTGWAWAENYGWIKFDCNIANACVSTEWRPSNSINPVVVSNNRSGEYLQFKNNIIISPVISKEISTPKSIIENHGQKTENNSLPSLTQKEDSFVNPEPKTPPGFFVDNKNIPSKKLVSILDKNNEEKIESKKSTIENINNFFIKKIRVVANEINSIPFGKLNLSSKIFNHEGSINSFIFMFLHLIIGMNI